MQIQIRQTSPTTSETTIRGHRVTIDRPIEKGGTDAGPMGGELFLASVGGCFMSTLLAAIRAHGNFMEFVPLLLLMIYMASDFHGFRVTAALSIVLLVARVLHAGGMLGMIPKGRLLGAVGTTLLLLVVSVLLVYAGFGLRQY